MITIEKLCNMTHHSILDYIEMIEGEKKTLELYNQKLKDENLRLKVFIRENYKYDDLESVHDLFYTFKRKELKNEYI